MRPAALFLVFTMACLIGAEEKKAQIPSRKPFDRCLKILKFGELNTYSEPAKGDAVAALGLLGDERAVPVLTEHLANEKNEHLRFQIVKALGWLKSPKAVSALEKALKSEDMHVRKVAAIALKEITGKDYNIEQRPVPPLPDLDELAKELARLQGGDRSPRPTKPFLETGKTYRFAFGGPQGKELTGKVVEAPVENWVKVQDFKGKRPVTSWVNLTAVAAVTLDPDQK